MSRFVVIYHDPCPDGSYAGWLFQQHAEVLFGENANVIYKGCGAGEVSFELTDWSDNNVWFLDLAPSTTALLTAIADVARHVHILDHHESSRVVFQQYSHLQVTMQLDMSKCGCQLTFDYIEQCYQEQSIPIVRPWLLAHIADQDLWIWLQLDMSRKILSAINEYYDAYAWTGLTRLYAEELQMGVVELKSKLIALGTPLVEAEDREITRLVKLTDLFNFTDPITKQLYIAGITQCNNVAIASWVGAKMLEASIVDFAFVYQYELKTNRWKCSLRSSAQTSNVNVALIAEHLGQHFNTRGGGHIAASATIIPNTTTKGLLILFDL